MRYILTALTLFITAISFAQLENANWCFGWNARANFNPPPTTTSTSSYTSQFTKSCASVSDASGQLLFYSDGSNVFDNNNMPITNGSGLYGYGGFSQQNLVVVPKPGNPGIYYIFTIGSTSIPLTGNEVGRGGIHYSVVDMTSGTGQIPIGLKNIALSNQAGTPIEYDFNTSNNPLFLSCKTRITTTLNSTGDKIWVTIIAVYYFQGQHTRLFYNYLVSSTGVGLVPDGTSPQPAVETILTAPNYAVNNIYTIASMKISPNGQLLCDAEEIVVNLYDYNNTNGTVSYIRTVYNPIWDAYHSVGAGVEFSPNSQLIYFSDNPYSIIQDGRPSENTSKGSISGSIYQYNIQKQELILIYSYSPNSDITPLPIATPWGLQLGVDNRIYVCTHEYQYHLGVIQFPDIPGTACGFVPNLLPLVQNTVHTGQLPQWVHKAITCLQPIVTPAGPIDYYTPLDASPAGRLLTSSIANGNQWYHNNIAIPGATAQTYNAYFGTGNYYVRNNGCNSNVVTVNFNQYGYGNYGEDIFDRLGAKIHPLQTSNYYCYNTTNNFIQQFSLGTTANYSWNFRVWPTGGTQNVSLTPGSYNPNSNQAQVNIGSPVSSNTYVQGVAELNGREIILDYFLTLSHPDFIPTNQQVCANAGQYIENHSGSSYSTLPGGSGFDWEYYNFGTGVIFSGPGAGQSSVLIPGRSTPQQMIVKFSGPTSVQKNLYYNWGGCYKEEYSVTLIGGCKVSEEMVNPNQINIYPNPSTNQITITSTEAIFYIEISDLTNPTLKTIKVNGTKSFTVNVSDLKPGVYNCKITTSKGIENQKIIIHR